MADLRVYGFVSRAKWLNYRGKIMLMAFIGTHVPLLAIIAYFVSASVADWGRAMAIMGVALCATLAGTGATLGVLNALLQPILLTSRGLRTYRTSRRLPDLPTHFGDEAGTLMADAVQTLRDLDRAIDELAHIDKVTSLPNRDRFLERVNERVPAQRPFAVCTARLVNYERLIATFGQDAADTALRQFAQVLKAALRPDAIPARVEDGAFAFVLTGSQSPADVAAQAETVLARLGSEFKVGDVVVTPDWIAGTALYPEDAADAETLLNHAIAARAEAGARQLAFFSPANREAAQARFKIEQELRRALANDEFRLHFQPVIDTRVGRAVGAEALVRWQHPEHGLVPPARFVPVAEASGLIDPIDQWVLRAACAQMRAWSAQGLDGMRVAVNLSARAFDDPALLRRIDEALARHSVPPGDLEIELTETAAMIDRGRTRAVFGGLRELGVHVAIDDFGTGYSSMSYLRDLPFDKLKIDREFVSGVDRTRNANAICAALIELSRGLDIAVLAEGAETEDEVRALHRLGCRLFQGYYFAKPMDADKFVEAINDLALIGRIAATVAGTASPPTAERATRVA